MGQDGQYLVPANSKRGMLIFGIFKPLDLGIFATGLALTFIMLIIFSEMGGGTTLNVIAIIPAGICSLLVIPIPNYHNVRVAIGEVVNYYSNNRNYVWRGWCARYESRDKQSK